MNKYFIFIPALMCGIIRYAIIEWDLDINLSNVISILVFGILCFLSGYTLRGLRKNQVLRGATKISYGAALRHSRRLLKEAEL